MCLSNSLRLILAGGCLVVASNDCAFSADALREGSTIRSITPQHDVEPATVAQRPSSPPSSSILAPEPGKTPTVPRAFPRPGAAAPAFVPPLVDPHVTSQTRHALGFYGGYSARATLSQLPRRTPIQAAAPQPMYRQIKPFHTVAHEPTVSPYLNLYREESDTESAPNYFAFVRPQVEQIEASRMQQREIQKLRGQVHGMSSTVAGPKYQAAGGGGGSTSVSARYMDTAQFYGGWRR